MSKAEKFIKDCTRGCSNELIAVESKDGSEVISYHEWLTPDQALKAVEIERENIVEKFCEYLDGLIGLFNDYRCKLKCSRTSADIEAAMQEIEDKSKAFTEAHKGETSEEILVQTRGKSLKDRVQPQNVWKPSIAQMQALDYVINLLASSESPTENDYFYNILNSMREQLKNIKR